MMEIFMKISLEFLINKHITNLDYDRLNFSEESIIDDLSSNRPMNIRLVDVDKIIAKRNIKPVTSTSVLLPATSTFDPNGLFSETIFGLQNTPERLVTFGYINLKTKIMHPIAYNNLLTLKQSYADIISGKKYAVFNKEEHDFEIVDENNSDADTGYSFFMSHFWDIQFEETESLPRNDKIKIFNKYKNVIFIDKLLVSPAGIRDIKIENGIRKSDDINNMYSTLINYTRALPSTEGDLDPIYDTIRYAIQRYANQVVDYYDNVLKGKGGFLQNKYSKRALALGTRNVISSARIAAQSMESNQFLKCTETFVPLFEAAKAFLPLVVYSLKQYFFNQIFDASFTNIALIDPSTNKLVYKQIDEKEKDKFLSSEGVEDIVNLFENNEFRTTPVQVYSKDGTAYYLFLIYDDPSTNNLILIRNLESVKNTFKESGREFNEQYIRPLTYIEMLYIATYVATIDKHVTVTRYPVLILGSDYPSKCHLVSTSPSREVTLEDETPTIKISLPHYPVLGAQTIDSASPHPSRLTGSTGLGGDFDGDTVSVNGILSKDANDEVAKYLNSYNNLLLPDGTLQYGFNTDLIKLSFYNLSIEHL